MAKRTLDYLIPSLETSDGAGVNLRRSLGSQRGKRVDPFLMLDEFSSCDPSDYIAGFPPHPHRGFETVTYMLDGRMRHEDHLGHVGELVSGGVQWMTAGRGIVHSEMPMQEEGRMRGFQLWINLPAAEKMKPPAYRDIAPEAIPVVELAGGGRARVVAGHVEGVSGTVSGPVTGITTDPLYLDVELAPGALFGHGLPPGHSVFLYPFEGKLSIGTDAIPLQCAGVLSSGDLIEARAGGQGARFLLLAAKPIGEPVVQYGPFVMNTQAEVEQAFRDYREGRF